jgi:EAL domain-containing protein (putative c-di-GMP-specific phosphodiesterase class I)
MALDMRRQAELLRDLRRAVQARALQLVYQPKVDARTQRTTGAEALLRWHDERRGLVGPEVFLPLAEKHGLIGELGRWVVEEATRQAGLWREQGLELRIALNLSASQLREPEALEHLCGCLQRHGIPPSHLTCEVTESVAMAGTAATDDAFARLRAAGVQLSIDDFGTGHSSLATLRQLPVAELKIDRAFVADLEHSPEARAVAAAVIRMAQRLQLRVVAEGVETEAQRDWLLEEGCDELQGWLLAKPMAPHLMAAWALGDQARESMPASFSAPPPAARPRARTPP